MADDSDVFLTPEQVSRKINMPIRTVLRHLKNGKIPGLKIGDQWRIPPRAFDLYVEAIEKSAIRRWEGANGETRAR